MEKDGIDLVDVNAAWNTAIEQFKRLDPARIQTLITHFATRAGGRVPRMALLPGERAICAHMALIGLIECATLAAEGKEYKTDGMGG